MTKELKDISTIDDIRLLVDTFYGKVRKDVLLGPIFDRVIGDHWDLHLQKMYGFWQTILLGEQAYFGNPFPPHAKLSLGPSHFETWLRYWKQTLDAHFAGTKAMEARQRAEKIAEVFQAKIAFMNPKPKEEK
ncbi:MAG TPA: group III truncated hemoglobin [Puia sp.]|nr:group III truncated hemoglobin [Puia sp.]